MQLALALLIHCALSLGVITKHYAPKGTFQIIDKTEPAFDKSDEEIAKLELVKRLKLRADDFRFTSVNHDKNGITYLYAHRFINGVKVSNEVASVVVKDGRVMSVTDTFSKHGEEGSVGSTVKERCLQETIPLNKAVEIAEKEIGAKIDDFPPSKVYLTNSDGERLYCYQFQLKNLNKDIFCRVSVDIHSGRLVQVIDYGSAFSIKAIKFTDLNPDGGFSTLGNEADRNASPLGWNTIGNQTFTTTQGNNVRAENNGMLVDGGADLVFDANFDATTSPQDNINSSIINTFYTLNKLHDIFYQFGFTESAGNFQRDNFGKGGKDNDSVIAYNHFENDVNNARFFTPADGQPGELRMFIFNYTNPNRDSGNDQTIVIHEFAHGVTNRLTGGPSTTSCLSHLISKGLGEGWSDIIAFMLTRKGTETHNDLFAMGEYATGKSTGLRIYPFSRNFTVNPWTCNYY